MIRYQPWMKRGQCRKDPDLFFPQEDKSTFTVEQRKQAAQICNACPVRNPCLRYALTHHGETRQAIWGGYTPVQRGQMLARLRRQRTEAG